MSASVLAKLQRAVEEQDVSAAEKAAHEALAAGLDPFVAINEGLAPAMKTISDLFDEGELYVPQILFAAEAFQNAMAILVKGLSAEEISKTKIGKVIVHTVQGDIHDIGKNIVAVLLENYGFRVIDLGRDVKNEVVLEEARKASADIVGLSALMTTTMPQMKRVIELFASVGFDCPVLVGGAATTRSFATQIGATGYGKDAQEAVAVALKVLQSRKAALR